jgi:hypothetical protein
MYRRTGNASELASAHRLSDESLAWALSVGDRCRRGKSLLVSLEVEQACMSRGDEAGREDVRLSLAERAAAAWDMLASSEVACIPLTLSRWTYRGGAINGRSGAESLRMLGMYLLETS